MQGSLLQLNTLGNITLKLIVFEHCKHRPAAKEANQTPVVAEGAPGPYLSNPSEVKRDLNCVPVETLRTGSSNNYDLLDDQHGTDQVGNQQNRKSERP